MSAEIIQLADYRKSVRRQSEQPAAAEAAYQQDTSPRFHFWTGASGKRYVHTVYSLFDCPPLDDANYILVHRVDKATREVVAVGRLNNVSATLNLAQIRQQASELGADEVHVHLLAASTLEAEAVEADLVTAQFR